MSLWGNGSSLEAVEVRGLGSIRGRALSTCHSLDLRTLVHITLAIQPLPTSARLGFGFLAPWQSVPLEDLGSLNTLGCTDFVRQPVLRPRQLCCQGYALALARPDMELCDDTGGVQGSTQGSPAMPASSRISFSLLSQEEARVSLVWHRWRMGALRHLSETSQAQYTPVISPLLFIPAAG